MRHSVILCVVLCALLALSWSGIARLIGLDGVAQMAFAALLLPMMAQTVLPAAFVADGLLKGAGDLGFLAAQMVAASALVFPIALVVLGDSLQGLWWAVCAWVMARALLCTWRLGGDRWVAVAVGQMRSKSS